MSEIKKKQKKIKVEDETNSQPEQAIVEPVQIDPFAELFPQQSEILLEKCFTGRQAPDFNDFESVLNCVTRMDSIKRLQYKDFQYMINTTEPVQVAPGILFELTPQATEDPKTGLVQKITYRLYSDDLPIKDIKDYIRKCRQEYESQRNNKLGNDAFFFDQVTTKEAGKQTALVFDKKKFETNRTFDNVFFEEKSEVEGRVKHFMTNKAWYAKRGIPYTLGFMFAGPPGVGKCELFGTPILKYDGRTVPIEQLKIGDQLMGDGSQPRTITSTTRGRDQMYCIKQNNGDDYTVNSAHILSLKLSIEFMESWVEKEGIYKLHWYENFLPKQKSFTVQKLTKRSSKTCFQTKELAYVALEAYKQALIDTGVADRKGDVCDISVENYLKKNKDWIHAFKGFKRGLVDWWAYTETMLDPYMMGYWLGDDTTNQPDITSQDSTVIKYFASNVPKYNCHLQFHGNHFMNSLMTYELIGNKHVPFAYKLNDVDSRRQLLAGFLDANGELCDGNCFEYSQKSRTVFDDITFVARSLGYMVSEGKPKVVDGTEYFQANIYGHGIELIPTKIPRKRARPYCNNKDPMLYEIEVMKVGEDDYAGFTLDGNGRYCHSDFTVTHNTSTIKAIANVSGRHVINVRLSDVHTNTQLKNLFYNPVLQVMNPETMMIEKFTVPIHQRLYVIEDIDCMTDLIRRRDVSEDEDEDQVKPKKPVKEKEKEKDKDKDKAKDRKKTKDLDTDDELERMHDEMMNEERVEMHKEKREDDEETSDRITKDSMLNILDGTLEIPDRMFCITTNFPDVIDEALVRPGRVDMIINFKKASRTIICEMFRSFYEQPFSVDDFDKIKDHRISQAFVNQVMFKNFTRPKSAIDELALMSNKRKPYITKKKKGDE